ncbi:MAG: putative transcriptional regulator [Alteromonadaceae bacterium]|jgi:predicted transcriptional regulator
MLTALMGGKALTATELALEADISAPTASSHLNKLVAGELLVVRKQGRHKYFQLQGFEIAELLESLLNISSKAQQKQVATGPSDPRLRQSRVCYDHLAGELGVTLYETLTQKSYIINNQSETIFTESGREFFTSLGVDFDQFKGNKRPLCKSCLDWSERKNHLAGIIGQWILNDIYHHGFAHKDPDSRALEFTGKGLKMFNKKYDILNSIDVS